MSSKRTIKLSDFANTPAAKLNKHLFETDQNKQEKPRQNKFNAEKTVVDDLTFDSKKEAKRYKELKLLMKQGKIAFLARQVFFNFHINGSSVGGYVADFVYTDAITGKMIVEDVKSEITRKLPVYRLKRRLMFSIHKITIKEV